MKTYLLYQLIFVCSLIVCKSPQSTATDNNLASTKTNVVIKDINEQVLQSMSKFKKHRIIARSRNYPYHAAITLKTEDTVLCQGALVASKWMLTSGSCFIRYAEYVEFLHVVAGIQNTWVRNVFTSDIECGIYHPQFHPNVETNDLVLIMLITSVDDTQSFVKPIELSRTEYPIGTHCNYSTYASAVEDWHGHEYQLFGLDLNLLDPSSCDGVPNDPKQVMQYACAGFGDLQFKTTDSNLEFEMYNITQIGSPIVCGNQLYGIKSRNDFFHAMNDIIPWVNTVTHRNEST